MTSRKLKFRVKDCIASGYLPAELPPVFTSTAFAEAVKQIKGPHGLRSTELIQFSIPHKGANRRRLGIPNPASYLDLAKLLARRYDEISIYLKSKNSSSTPVFTRVEERSDGDRYIRTKDFYIEYRRKCFELSHGMNYELSIDISRFYPTIYTHTIPWAIHGRQRSKIDRSTALIGNVIDKSLRMCQSDQTFGIPIGPDISHLIGEIICCAIDREIRRKHPDVKFIRYRDDYRFYVGTRSEADLICSSLQGALSDYMLAINPEKTQIAEVPTILEPEWVAQLRKFSLHPGADSQKEELESFFSLCLRLARMYPKEPVIKYAFHKLKNESILPVHWNLYISLLFRLIAIDGSAIREFAEIAIAGRKHISADILKRELGIWLDRHIPSKNEYEILWCLWLHKVFHIRIQNTHAAKLQHAGVLIVLMLYDMRNESLINSSVSFRMLDRQIASANYNTEWWMLKYECGRNGWIVNLKSTNNGFFTELKKLKVNFYKSDALTLPSRSSKLNRSRGLLSNFFRTLY